MNVGDTTVGTTVGAGDGSKHARQMPGGEPSEPVRSIDRVRDTQIRNHNQMVEALLPTTTKHRA
jgi:hypothetical protein